MELSHKLSEAETQRTDKIRVLLRNYCHLLEKISFLPPADVCRLIHTEATMLNQSLLANRRSVARLLLLLQEENLQQKSLLRLHWEDCLSRWRRRRGNEIIDRFRSLCSCDGGQQLVLQKVQETKQTQRDLTERRRDLIYQICALVPPSCSTALVSDWFNQLTAVNQQIDSVHADLLHQLRCCYEQTWQDRLAEVQRCREALSALQLSEEEVNHVVSSQLLTLIGRSQSQDEERLAALDLCCDSAARRALALSRCVFVVMRGAALLWETHSRRIERREEELQQHLDELRRSQQQHVQRKKLRLDDLLGGLRQESGEDALKTALDKTVHYLQDVKHSCRQRVSDQCRLVDLLPSLFLEELLSYSSSLSSFYHLSHAYRPSPEELQNLHPSSTSATDPETSGGAEIQKPVEMTENQPISCQNDTDPAQPSQDWLTEAESSLLELCDISSSVTFTSSRGVAYSGPAFRCPAPDPPQQETHLSLFPVELLPHTLSRTRTLFLDHLERRFRDVLSSAAAVVRDRKEAVRLEQELQLKQLNPKHIRTHVYQPRLAELQRHGQLVDAHCEEALDVLTSCRERLQELQTSISRKNREFTVALSRMEDDVLTADSSQRVAALSSALQDRLDQHIKDTQRCRTSFRQTVQARLQEVRNRTTRLLNSFRLFSEGGEFAPQEVKLFQRRLKEETKQISVTEEAIFSELEAFESRSLQQVKEASGGFEEKLSFLKSEVTFMEKVQKIISSTQVHIKAEAASSQQQQAAVSSRLQDLRRELENTQVSPNQVCSLLSSVSEGFRKCCQHLDFSLDSTLQENLSAHPEPRKQVCLATPPGLLQPSRMAGDLLDDPVVGVIKSLNRFCLSRDAERPDRGRPAAGPVQRPQQRCPESVGTLSVRRGCRSIRTDRKFQVFGPKPEPEASTRSFSATINGVLWEANDVLLLVAEDFYQSERCAQFLLVPDSLDQWADRMQQRLLGYQEQARRFLSTSREELVTHLSVLEELLRALPAVLISNHERQRGAGLREEVGRVRLKLKETLVASEKEKGEVVRRLRASLRHDELQTLIGREELRQQQLHGAICSAHQEIQDFVRVRGEEFVTSLASLTENLLHQLDDLLTPAETEAASSQHPCEDTVTMETEAETGSSTWSGIAYLSPPTNSAADPLSTVTMPTTASITTTRCTLGHLAVIEQRDAAVKRFEQLFRSEMSRSDDDKRRRLSELQSWNTHWRQQIHTLRHTHTH
ncbi:coiled-coil domain-containing protein 180 [Micropterus dolomieu]|uniref:coiled-coil domain-containing protein 180 n=1 Tax=Micropterus dolomieu TaxID=147949 RepID=UPI001E8E8ECF|nr:coiled-coil domain-containing protein 180 [Micropterus dolomieu]